MTEQEAVARIWELDGSVELDRSRPGHPATTAMLCGAAAGEAVGLLRWLPHLSFVDLSDTTTTDGSLEHLAGLTELRRLYLNRTRVGDAGLRHLAGLTNLRELTLGATRVTDAGLNSLSGLTQLEWLYLVGTGVTRQGVERLQQVLPVARIDLTDS